MSIVPVSALNFSTANQTIKKTGIDKKAEPVAVQPQNVQNSGEALRSYFLGSKAVSFGFSCSTSKFVTKKMEDVPCCCCGGKMPLNRQLGSVVSSFAKERGTKLADKIEQDRSYFRSNQGTIAGMIAIEARKNPKLDAQGAIAEIRGNFEGKLQEYCQGVLSQTDEIAKQRLGEENPVSKAIAQEQENVAEGHIDRVSFTEKLVKMQQNGQIDDESYDKIINTAMLLPQNTEQARKHMNKVAFKENQGIFHELLKESTQTIEHVRPHSLGGKNDTDNYMAECGECNHPRGNMSYLKWLKIHPEYPVNAQKHIEWFQQQIVDGNIDDRYDSYGSKIKETLSKESKGRMQLKVLNSDKIEELRNKREAGHYINVEKEIDKQEGEKEKNLA